jgi:hypothetical protein
MRLQVHICTVTSQVDYSIPGSLFVPGTANALEVLAAALLGARGLCYSSAVSVRSHLTPLPMSPSVRRVPAPKVHTKAASPRQMEEDASEQT